MDVVAKPRGFDGVLQTITHMPSSNRTIFPCERRWRTLAREAGKHLAQRDAILAHGDPATLPLYLEAASIREDQFHEADRAARTWAALVTFGRR